MNFRVSVIIPAYNAEKFIEKAIHSALQQDEVSEVIVVNDGSTDRTLEIVETIHKNNPIIKLYHHYNKVNKGRSASRNLGIKNASGNFIAFLDADDFYLKNRFTSDKKMFRENIEIDGVYNAIGASFYRKSTKLEQERLKLTTINEIIHHDQLFEKLLAGKNGHFSIDGLTIKRSVFEESGFFNESLNVMEDTELIFKMALKCKLVGGELDNPVAIRGVHVDNVFNNQELYNNTRIGMFESLVIWSSKNDISLNRIDKLMKELWISKYKEKRNLSKHTIYWVYLFCKSSRLVFSSLSIKYFPIFRLRQKLFPFLYKRKVKL